MRDGGWGILCRWCSRDQPDPKGPHTGTVGFATLAGAGRELHQLLFNLGGPVGGHQVRPSHAAAGLELTQVRNGS